MVLIYGGGGYVGILLVGYLCWIQGLQSWMCSVHSSPNPLPSVSCAYPPTLLERNHHSPPHPMMRRGGTGNNLGGSSCSPSSRPQAGHFGAPFLCGSGGGGGGPPPSSAPP